ncbi:MAG: hypothetical protein HYY64_16550 [Candidatus Rokubacteria bacterium]|nr:hypothetical protein [Candidatus Rokubacteria bacterium]
MVGPLFVVAYLSLWSWGPIDEAIQRLQHQPGLLNVGRDASLLQAEALVGLVSLLLLTPLAGMVALFMLLFVMVILAITLGPLVRLVGLPDWLLVLVLGAAASGAVYAESEVWLPYSWWLLDHIATAYIVLVL